MPFQRVPNGVKISIEGTCQSVPFAQTHHAVKQGGYTQSDLVTLANAVDLMVASVMLPVMVGEYLYLGTRVRGLNAEADYEVFDNSSSGGGGGGSTAVNPTVAYAVKRITGFTGRSSRGRVFFGPLRNDWVDANSSLITTAGANAIATVLEAVTSTIASAGFQEVIVQRVAGGDPLAEAVTRAVIGWAFEDFVLDNQRRRKPRP